MISCLKIKSLTRFFAALLLSGLFLVSLSSCTKETFTCDACPEAGVVLEEEEENITVEPRSESEEDNGDDSSEDSGVVSEDVINP